MILEVYRDFSKSKRGSKKVHLACDQCSTEYTIKYYRHYTEKESYYSRACSNMSLKVGGKSYNRKLQADIARYGCHSSKSIVTKSKMRETCERVYSGTSSIASSKVPRDKVALKTFYRDKEQNKWFKKNNLKLIRITDKEFEKDGYSLTL